MKSNQQHRDSLKIELWELKKQLRGINPKLAVYEEIKKKIDELEKQLNMV